MFLLFLYYFTYGEGQCQAKMLVKLEDLAKQCTSLILKISRLITFSRTGQVKQIPKNWQVQFVTLTLTVNAIVDLNGTIQISLVSSMFHLLVGIV